MADRQLCQSWGSRSSLAFTAVVLGYVLIAPVCAHAASLVPGSGVQVPAVVPAGAQAAVGAAVAQASAAAVPAAAAAAVPTAAAAALPAPARAAADAVPARARAAAAAVSTPAPQAAPSVPHVSVASVPAPSVAPTASQVNVPHVTVPGIPVPSPQRATSHIPDPAASAAAGAAQRAGSLGGQPGGVHPGGRHGGAKPSRQRPARPQTSAVAYQASPHIAPPIPWHPIVAGASVTSLERDGPSLPVRAARIPERRRPIAVHRAPARELGIPEASATAWPTVPTTASLPPGGAGGPSAGGSGGAAGGIAAAVLALVALTLLRGFLPGLLALDVVPWRSALLAFRLERPG